MAEEKVDQAPAAPPTPSAPAKPELPKTGFFDGDTMMKFAEQAGYFGPPSPKPASPPPPAKPCDDCPPTAEEIASLPADAQGRKAIKVLKVKGKLIPVYSDEELTTLAQKGLHFTRERQKDAEIEKRLKAKETEISERESKLSGVLPMMEKIASYIEAGKLPGASAESRQAAKAEIQEDLANLTAEELEELPPALRKVAVGLQKMEQRFLAEEANRKRAEQATEQENQLKTFGELVGKAVEEARVEYPFGDDVLDEETGDNLTRTIFSGILSTAVNQEIGQGKTIQDINFPETLRNTAKRLSTFVKKIGGANGGSPAKITTDLIAKQHPKVFEEIGQSYLAEYLKKQGEAPPVLKTTAATPESRVTERIPGPPRKFASLDDALRAGMEDASISAALDSIGKTPIT